MTDDELKAIEARANAATAPPWTWRGLCDDESKYDELRSPAKPDEPIVETDSECYGPREPDAEFIAHARTDVPALIAEVRRLRAARTAAIETIRQAFVAGWDAQRKYAGESTNPLVDAWENYRATVDRTMK